MIAQSRCVLTGKAGHMPKKQGFSHFELGEIELKSAVVRKNLRNFQKSQDICKFSLDIQDECDTRNSCG